MSKAWERAQQGAPARQFLIRKGWSAAAVAALPDDAIALDTEHERGHRLLMPLRLGDEVVDVVALGDEGLPRPRGRARHRPVLGSLEDAVVHGLSGEPVFVAVRPDDYLLAQCIVAQRRGRVAEHGVALGVAAVGGLEELLDRMQRAVKKFDPGSIELWPVQPAPQWLSNLGLVSGRTWELTHSQMRDELVKALDWARVRVPGRAVAVRELEDSAGCWSVWDSAPLLVDPGSHEWRRTKRMPGVRQRGVALLKAYAYRLPLDVAVRATHWRQDQRMGEVKTITPNCPDYDLGDLVASWLQTHGVELWRDKTGREWAYWDRQLMCLSGEDKTAFVNKLSKLSHLSKETRAGRVALGQVQVDAWYSPNGQPRPLREVRPWSWSDAPSGKPMSAMALGDVDDRVVVLEPGKVRVEPNARSVVLKRPPRPIQWEAVAAAEWARLLYDRMGRWLTCEPALRALQVSWALMALFGRRLKSFAPVRPILWPIGPAGSGKTYAAEMFEALAYGTRKPFGKPTPASLMALAEDMPIFTVDNAETAMRSEAMTELLLLAFLGAVRPKRKLNTDSGVDFQQIEAWFLLTSIEGGAVHELIQRSLFCRHDVVEFGDPEHDEHDPPQEVADARDALLSGGAAVWAERVLPRLVAGEGVELTQTYREAHPRHPLVRQLKTLASLAIIADVLVDLDPRWAVGGGAALDRWLAVLGETTSEMLVSVDPIGGALRVLLDDFNALDVGPSGPWQPLVETERVPVTPIFAAHKGGLTLDPAWALKRRARGSVEARWPVVVGVVGTYGALHATLYERTRSRGVGYADRVPTADILARRMRHTSDWTTFSKVARDGRSGSWLHAWVLDESGSLGPHGDRIRSELGSETTA